MNLENGLLWALNVLVMLLAPSAPWEFGARQNSQEIFSRNDNSSFLF
jgi:hypothetical protein